MMRRVRCAVNVVSTLVAVFLVDRLGRKFLLIQGAIQMIIAEITVGVTLKFEFEKSVRGEFGPDMVGKLPHNVSAGVVAVICIFIAGFAWSWGPIGDPPLLDGTAGSIPCIFASRRPLI